VWLTCWAGRRIEWPEKRHSSSAGGQRERALDTEWSDPNAKDEALNTLVRQLDSLDAWLRQRLPEELRKPPLKEHLDTLAQIRTQDLEPDPDGGGGDTRAFAKVWLPTGAFHRGSGYAPWPKEQE